MLSKCTCECHSQKYNEVMMIARSLFDLGGALSANSQPWWASLENAKFTYGTCIIQGGSNRLRTSIIMRSHHSHVELCHVHRPDYMNPHVYQRPVDIVLVNWFMYSVCSEISALWSGSWRPYIYIQSPLLCLLIGHLCILLSHTEEQGYSRSTASELLEHEYPCSGSDVESCGSYISDFATSTR